MKRQRKKYQTPKRPWDKERIEEEKEILKKFGLKNKREIWRAEAQLRKYRRLARELVGEKDEEKKKELTEKLVKVGILTKESAIDDVLSLTVENFLNRRLQTVVHKRDLANSPKQARQFIAHGHVLIDNKRVPFPSFMVPVKEEGNIVVKITPVKKTTQTKEVGEGNGGEESATAK